MRVYTYRRATLTIPPLPTPSHQTAKKAFPSPSVMVGYSIPTFMPDKLPVGMHSPSHLRLIYLPFFRSDLLLATALI